MSLLYLCTPSWSPDPQASVTLSIPCDPLTKPVGVPRITDFRIRGPQRVNLVLQAQPEGGHQAEKLDVALKFLHASCRPPLQAVLSPPPTPSRFLKGSRSFRHQCGLGRPVLGTHLEDLHFAEGEPLGEAQAELDRVSVFSQVAQCQPHGEAGRRGQAQDSGSGGETREKLQGPR